MKLPQIGTTEQKKAVFKFLAQNQYQGTVEEILAGPVRAKNGGIAGRFRDGEKIVYCFLQPSGDTWEAQFEELQLAENDQDTVDSFTEKLRSKQLTNGWINQIRDLLNISEDLISFQEALTNNYQVLSINEFSSIMGEAMTASRLAGQYEVEEDDI
jgi:hypothetical protein